MRDGLMSRRVLDLTYEHAQTDPGPWRHAFRRGVAMRAQRDGSIVLRRSDGGALHDLYATARGRTRFLKNPPNDEPSPAYQRAVEQYRREASAFNAVTERYRARKISDAAYLAARRAFQAADRTLDDAEAQEIRRVKKNAPSTSRRRRAPRGRAVPRKKKRRPPHGFSTWRAYMASIRPNRSAARVVSTRESGTMKRKRGKRRGGKHRARSGGKFVARQNAPRHRRHRARRNPPGFMSLVKSVPRFAGRAAIQGGGMVVGIIAARKVRGLTGKQPGTIIGSAIELATGLAAGLLVSAFVSPTLGEAIAAGGVAAPLMTFVQNMKIPHISDSIGDDGYVIGDGTGLTLVSEHPEDYGRVVGEISGPYTRGEGGGVQGYTGGTRAAAMSAAVNG